MQRLLMAAVIIATATSANAQDIGRPAAPSEVGGGAAAWFTTDDYPADALRAGAEGMVAIKYDIDATGKVTFCSVTQTSGSAALDETSCRLMKERGRFTPALDKKGKPIASQGTRRVTWQIPNERGMPLSAYPLQMISQFDIDEEGVVSNCMITTKGAGKEEGPKAFPAETCSRATGTQAAKIIGADGKPVKTRMQITLEAKPLPAM